jgi:hypothetical protein
MLSEAKHLCNVVKHLLLEILRPPVAGLRMTERLPLLLFFTNRKGSQVIGLLVKEINNHKRYIAGFLVGQEYRYF